MRATYTVPGSDQPRRLGCEGFEEGELGVTLLDSAGEAIAFVSADALVAIEPD